MGWRTETRHLIELLNGRLNAVESQVAELVEELQESTGLSGWQKQPDLIDQQFRPVLGIHTGGGSSPDAIAERMGQRIQAAPIYWKSTASPKKACKNLIKAGTTPRLELCLPHIFTSTGNRMPSSGGSFWARGAAGEYDEGLVTLLQEVGELNNAIILSTGHESDLRSEDGASPKSENPLQSTHCGDWSEYAGYWEHFATLARQYAPKARLFLNLSGGYSDAPKRWSKMVPDASFFDFFGWDPYSQYGKTTDDWDSFEGRMKMFGRWDWYKENLPDTPIIIGETGVCAGPEPGGEKDAGKWVADMVDFMVENRWQGVGTGGGISQIHYFSHHYDAHPRCLDDNGTHNKCTSGQKWAVLPQIGADERLSWAS